MQTLFRILAAALVLHLLLPGSLRAQQVVTTEINRLEQQEMQAMMQRDTAARRRLWSPAYVVNNPATMIVTVPQMLAFLRGGQIDYSTMERIVERVTVAGDVAVAMGREVITPQRQTTNAGHLVTRRYTDVWQRQGSTWRLLARQATNTEVKYRSPAPSLAAQLPAALGPSPAGVQRGATVGATFAVRYPAGMTAPYLLPLPTHGTPDYGWLTVAEAPGLPFEVKRTYWITHVPPAQVRGRHAHHTLEQLLVAAHGTVRLRIRVPGQAELQCFCLTSPTEALYLPPHCWPDIHFEPGAVLLCLASAPYDPADYLHEQA